MSGYFSYPFHYFSSFCTPWCNSRRCFVGNNSWGTRWAIRRLTKSDGVFRSPYRRARARPEPESTEATEARGRRGDRERRGGGPGRQSGGGGPGAGRGDRRGREWGGTRWWTPRPPAAPWAGRDDANAGGRSTPPRTRVYNGPTEALTGLRAHATPSPLSVRFYPSPHTRVTSDPPFPPTPHVFSSLPGRSGPHPPKSQGSHSSGPAPRLPTSLGSLPRSEVGCTYSFHPVLQWNTTTTTTPPRTCKSFHQGPPREDP